MFNQNTKGIEDMTEEAIKRNAEEFIEGNCIYDKNSRECDYIRAAYIAGAKSMDDDIAELEEQHEEDMLFVEEAEKLLKFHRAFIEYLNNKAIGDKNRIIEAVYDNDLNCFEGYVKVTKTIENGKIMLEFELERGGKYKAEWQPSDNYACWQTCGIMGDDYSGFLLFPTYKEDEYFCMYYQC